MNINATQIDRAARAVGTPCYVYNAAALRNRAQQLKRAVHNAQFFYSLKANPNKSIVRVLSGQGIGAEVCSHHELMVALAAGVAPKNIIFVGPAKSPADIQSAVDQQIKAIIVESMDELHRINEIATSSGEIQNIALRINPEFHTRGAKLSMSGKPTQFGIDPSELEQVLADAKAAQSLRLVGIHIYMGTRILDHRVVLENTQNILEFATGFIRDQGVSLDFVDIGGGFGVPYSEAEPHLDLDALGRGLTDCIDGFRATHPDTKVAIELGRYMVAEAGVFVTKVEYVKTSKNTRFAVCDGGSNAHAAAAQGASFKRNFPIKAVAPRSGTPEAWNISGPLCTPTDLIGQNVQSPPLEPGDLVRIDRSGAYGLSFSPTNFLSFQTPAEVLFDGEDLHLIRQSSSFEEYLSAQEARLLPKQSENTKEHQYVEL